MAASPPAVTANLLEGLNVDEYFRTSKGGGLSFLSDALGSTIALVNSSGGVTADYSYTPFGKTTITGTSSTAFQFTGRENDNIGLYYYRARYYNPTYQRFIAQDPIGFAGGDPNLYGYTLNSPTNFRDPSGKILSLLIAGGVIGGGAACSNYGAYERDAVTDEQYAEAISFGVAHGVLSPILIGVVGRAIAGALGARANSLFDQSLSHPRGGLDLGEIGESADLGAFRGALAAGAEYLGDQIISENPVIGQEIPEPEFQSGYPTPGYTSYGTQGAIAGGEIGTAIGTSYGP